MLSCVKQLRWLMEALLEAVTQGRTAGLETEQRLHGHHIEGLALHGKAAACYSALPCICLEL